MDNKSNMDNKSKVITKSKEKKKKCFDCNKKLGLLDYSCKCSNFYCIKHRLPETHNCKFDYQKEGKEIIIKNNPLVICEKIIKI